MRTLSCATQPRRSTRAAASRASPARISAKPKPPPAKKTLQSKPKTAAPDEAVDDVPAEPQTSKASSRPSRSAKSAAVAKLTSKPAASTAATVRKVTPPAKKQRSSKSGSDGIVQPESSSSSSNARRSRAKAAVINGLEASQDESDDQVAPVSLFQSPSRIIRQASAVVKDVMAKAVAGELDFDIVRTKPGKRKAPAKAAATKKAAAPKEKKVKRATGNDLLTPRANVTTYDHEPFFESDVEIPFVSVANYSKLAIRAVLTDNENLLRRLIADKDHVSSLQNARSVHIAYTSLDYALIKNNLKLADLLVKDHLKPLEGRVEAVTSLLEQQKTGTKNFHMLGRATRNIRITRGGREGNNAFTKDSSQALWNPDNGIKIAMQVGSDIDVINLLINTKTVTSRKVYEKIFEAIRHGHRKLAASLIELYGGSSFNDLHVQVLRNDAEPLKPFKQISVKKKGMDNKDVTPLHCACTNPNDAYVRALVDAEPDFNHPDKDNLRALHYAAACEGTKPLQFLLTKNVSPYDVDKQGNQPLHTAAKAGRADNINLLCDYIRKTAPNLVFLNKKNRQSFSPLHIAAMRGHAAAVRALLANGADVNVETGAGKDKITPLMLAAQHGHLEVVEELIGHSATLVDKKDRLKRTALTHAIINGNAHIASHLLKLGASIDSPDTSGNTNAHYAAAYGWYFCLKLLIAAGAKLDSLNDWKLSPLAVAYLKGHIGLVDLLLEQESIDINCRDDNGMTLAHLTLANCEAITKSVLDQMKFLVEEKGAKCGLADAQGNNPLHILAATEPPVVNPYGAIKTPEELQQSEAAMNDIAALLISNGCDVKAMNEEGFTPAAIAIKAGNVSLADFILAHGGLLEDSGEREPGKPTILHKLVNHFPKPVTEVVRKIHAAQPDLTMRMLSTPDESGFTPFLLAIKAHSAASGQSKQSAAIRAEAELLLALLASINENVFRQSVVVLDKEGNIPPQALDADNESDDDNSSESSHQSRNSSFGEDKETADKHPFAGQNCLHLSAQSTAGLAGFLGKLLSQTGKPELARSACEQADSKGRTPLFCAIEAKNEKAALDLVSHYPAASQLTGPLDETNSKGTKFQSTNNTPLMYAIKQQLWSLATSLIDAQAPLAGKNSLGNTALHMAAAQNSFGATEVLRKLIERGANLDEGNGKSRTPLHLAVNAISGSADISTEVVETLLEGGAKPLAKDALGRTPLHYAFVKIRQHKSAEPLDPIAVVSLIQEAMSKYKNPSGPFEADIFGCTPLHYAAKRGANICCLAMLKHGANAKANVLAKAGNTALGYAVKHKHINCALTLLQANASISLPIVESDSEKYESDGDYLDKNTWMLKELRDPLPRRLEVSIPAGVIRNEWQGVIFIVLDQLEKEQKSFGTLLRAAIEYGKYNLAMALIRIAKTKKVSIASATSSVGNESTATSAASATVQQETPIQTLFRVALSSCQNAELQKRLAEALVDAGIPLWPDCAYAAAENQNIALLEFLAERFQGGWAYLARLPQRAEDGHSVLTKLLIKRPTLEKSFLDILKKLINAKADINLRAVFPAEKDPPNSADSKKRVSPLISSICHRDHFDFIKFLLTACGANPDFSDDDGLTPMMHAVRTNDAHIVKLLLDKNYAKPKSALDAEATVAIDETKSSSGSENEQSDAEHGDDSDDGRDSPNSGARSQQPDEADGGMDSAGGENDDGDIDDDADEEVDRQSSVSEASSHDTEPAPPSDDEGPNAPPAVSRSASKGQSGKAPAKPLAPRILAKMRAVGALSKYVPRSQLSGTWPELKKVLSQASAAKQLQDSQFQNTSNVNLQAVDCKGRSIAHHLASPMRWGGYENIELLEFLARLGMTLNLKDKVGKTPLDYAKASGQRKLAQTLQTMLQLSVREDQHIQPAVEQHGRLVPKFREDARQFLETVRAKKSSNQQTVDNKRKPHRNSGHKDNGELLTDASNNNRLFDVLLNKVDVKFGYTGFYNFYRMQLIKRKGADLFVVFTNWGRIGTEGEYQRTPFNNLEDASKLFQKIFKEKTGNEWKNIANFNQLPNKYRLIEIQTVAEPTFPQVEIKLDDTRKLLELPQDLSLLIKDISNVGMLQKNTRLVRQHNINADTLAIPFGSLKREVILQAKDILQEAGLHVQALEKLNESAITKPILAQMHQEREALASLTNQFYSLVPFSGCEASQLTIIDRIDLVVSLQHVLNNLLDMEIAGAIVLGACFNKSKVHPLDYIYGCINCDFKSLDPNGDEAQNILRYIENSAADVKPEIKGIYSLQSPKQEDAFEPNRDMDNQFLLWHGTSPANLISILSTGLLAAPPSAVHTGYLFGKGIYTSDVFAKSYNYCRKSPGGQKYALLCQVALGKIKEVDDLSCATLANVKDGQNYNSVRGLGKEYPDPTFNVTTPTGAIMPLGKLRKFEPKLKGGRRRWLCLNYNEYIVYDPGQVVTRYLVVFE